jgi:hypothetical protein
MTQRQKCTIDYMTFSRLLGLGSKDERCSPMHNEDKYKPKELPFMFPSRDLAIEGKADQLNPTTIISINSFMPLLILR